MHRMSLDANERLWPLIFRTEALCWFQAVWELQTSLWPCLACQFCMRTEGDKGSLNRQVITDTKKIQNTKYYTQ